MRLETEGSMPAPFDVRIPHKVIVGLRNDPLNIEVPGESPYSS